MNKNTIIGIVLMGLVIIGFTYLNRPKENPSSVTSSPEAKENVASTAENNTSPSIVPDSLSSEEASHPDSIAPEVPEDVFTRYQKTTPLENLKLENEKIAVTFSNLGAFPSSVCLKEYKNLALKKKGDPLYLFQPEDFSVNFLLRTIEKGLLETKQLKFVPLQTSDSTINFRLNFEGDGYLAFHYTLKKNDYRLLFSISGKNLAHIFPSNMRYIDFEMEEKMPHLEKSWVNENNYTGIFYKFLNDDVERLNEKKQKNDKQLSQPLNWVAFKGKFFTNTLIASAKNSFEEVKLSHQTAPKDSEYMKTLRMSATIPFANIDRGSIDFTYYMGPLEHHLLKSYDKNEQMADADKLHLERLVYVGGSVFRWINLYLIMPIVDFLQRFISSWGIIILLLTVIIKLFLSPLTFKSYMSQAKMRVLRPQVEKINEKYPGKDQQSQLKRSQETMQLYRNAGASPLSGCMPMLLQMPFLISLYMFFPTAIYLRGEPFLWAHDLSSYDAVISWNFNIPILSGLMGNHISLFCLLWAVTNILYSKYTMSGSSGMGDNSQMKMMKTMPYIMSIMFFFFFNQNASGLCYYYFISTLITILQFVLSRLLINEEKVLMKLEKNKKKPRKKSGFMARLEEAQRMQEKMMKEQQKKRR